MVNHHFVQNLVYIEQILFTVQSLPLTTFSKSQYSQTTVHMTAVLITGATGKQGGSLIRSLVSRNAPFEILAVTRNPTSASAQKLKSLSSSIRLVEGDLDQPAAIFQKAQSLSSSPIWGVYSMQVIEFPTAILPPPPPPGF